MELRSHHIAVTRTARYYTLGEPGPAVRELWLACHGYGQLAADFAMGLRALADPTRLVVAPEALSRFYLHQGEGRHGPESSVGATWMTREDRLTDIDDYVAYLDRLLATVRIGLDEPLRLVALGFSQGTATISRWAARTEAPIDDLVLWGGRIAEELEPSALRERWTGLRVTFVAGARDRWAPPQELRTESESLERQGIAARVRTFNGGHRLDDDTLLTISRDSPSRSPIH